LSNFAKCGIFKFSEATLHASSNFKQSFIAIFTFIGNNYAIKKDYYILKDDYGKKDENFSYGGTIKRFC
jgi:hypothetical protein